MTEEERKNTAYHESGHAVVARMGDARVQEMMDAIALFNMIFEKETETIK